MAGVIKNGERCLNGYSRSLMQRMHGMARCSTVHGMAWPDAAQCAWHGPMQHRRHGLAQCSSVHDMAWCSTVCMAWLDAAQCMAWHSTAQYAWHVCVPPREGHSDFQPQPPQQTVLFSYCAIGSARAEQLVLLSWVAMGDRCRARRALFLAKGRPACWLPQTRFETCEPRPKLGGRLVTRWVWRNPEEVEEQHALRNAE
eukprot:686249-Pelagomonas_calceolata.AAC.1